MSTFRVNTLVAADGTSPTTLTKQEASKAWCTNNDTAILDSFNVATFTDSGVGVYTMTHTNSLVGGNTPVTSTHRGTSFRLPVADHSFGSGVVIRVYNQPGALSDGSTNWKRHGDLA